MTLPKRLLAQYLRRFDELILRYPGSFGYDSGS
jgi:hypothetical protein